MRQCAVHQVCIRSARGHVANLGRAVVPQRIRWHVIPMVHPTNRRDALMPRHVHLLAHGLQCVPCDER